MSSQIYEGQIPDGWEVIKLGEISLIKTGSRNNQDKSSDGEFPFFVRSATVERINTYSYDCEAILIPGEGGIGSIYHYINGKFDAHQRVYVIRDFNKNIDAKFVFFALKEFFGKYALQNTVKATVDSLRLPTFQNFEFLIPSDKAEQERIAQVLGDMDDLISAKCELLDKKRAIKQAAAQQLLTPKPHWHTTTIGEICEISAGGDLSRLTFSPIKTDKFLNPIYSNAVSDNGLYGYSSDFDYEGNFITVTARGYIGYAAARNGKFCSIGRLLNLKPKLNISYFYVAEYINHFIDFVIESTGVPQLTAPQISKYKISLPKDKTEQEKIAQILSDMDDEISALQDEIEKLKMIKQGAMDELLSGKIRLKG